MHATTTKHYTYTNWSAFSGKAVDPGKKDLPYVSGKYVQYAHNFNGVTELPDGSGKKALCRHIAARLGIERASLEAGKKLYAHKLYGSPDAVRKHLGHDPEKDWTDLSRNACERFMISCDQFGHSLADWARGMQEGERKTYLLASGHHVMAFDIYRKTKGRIVIHFFDPNQTDVSVRCEVRTVDELASDKYALRNFMIARRYTAYFGAETSSDREQECVVYHCTDVGRGVARFEINAGWNGSSPAILHHLLSDGSDPKSISDIDMARFAPDLRLQVLSAKSAKGTPGLSVALQNGHADAIRAWGQKLARVSFRDRIHLLAAKRADGAPGICLALQNGHTDAIRAWLEEVARLPATDRIALLAAIDGHGTPGIFLAFHQGHHEAIRIWGDEVMRLPVTDRIPLLLAKAADGVPGIFIALRKGHTEAIRAWGELVKKLPGEARTTLMDQLTGLESVVEAALHAGHSEALTVWGQLLE